MKTHQTNGIDHATFDDPVVKGGQGTATDEVMDLADTLIECCIGLICIAALIGACIYMNSKGGWIAVGILICSCTFVGCTVHAITEHQHKHQEHQS